MIDDLVDDPASVGVVKLRHPRDSQLVDHADEGTGLNRWPDGEDTHADHLPIRLRDDDRGGGNEQEVAQVVHVQPGIHIRRVARHEAGGRVEIGMSSGSDVYLHEGLSGAIRSGRAA